LRIHAGHCGTVDVGRTPGDHQVPLFGYALGCLDLEFELFSCPNAIGEHAQARMDKALHVEAPALERVFRTEHALDRVQPLGMILDSTGKSLVRGTDVKIEGRAARYRALSRRLVLGRGRLVYLLR